MNPPFEVKIDLKSYSTFMTFFLLISTITIKKFMKNVKISEKLRRSLQKSAKNTVIIFP